MTLSGNIILKGESKLGKFPEDMIEAARVAQFIKDLKEEFNKNWSFEFKDSVLKNLTSHDEMCFTKEGCKCIKIMNEFIDKLAGSKLI